MNTKRRGSTRFLLFHGGVLAVDIYKFWTVLSSDAARNRNTKGTEAIDAVTVFLGLA
ncbi:hypothetical protein JOF47_001794 [Paeniglutamicibacter kerguelensis]|uniref:Uncharacterized protein n=1 Tax=Paeniglutamicibacter kerguelensis TaxID=254788 RepID=A0ABS4XD08_9MICC|nr:hypothetical protein [Paeniglutamicibacter kerguelensis]